MGTFISRASREFLSNCTRTRVFCLQSPLSLVASSCGYLCGASWWTSGDVDLR
ncbi:hypothetical protein GT037_009801 [Alternaria burnsii]|uniref:Uncharacterized protein n=1 Tax=Alternaria burnsii TaxID=1187904 RepID=A0A8H7AVD6_9PLEO|nr:uncharacterized protein GT037_009801 [Alternaria burnsii]KAF7672291.1 hypothetical protein GT037_009801 [Alternaria burnsii]